MKNSPAHGMHFAPLPFEPMPGVEVVELFGEFGVRQFEREVHASDPLHGWLDTEPSVLLVKE